MYYEDLANNKERVELTLDVETFLSKLIVHIPPKHFKMIKRFGIYSRNVNKEIKNIMETMRKYDPNILIIKLKLGILFK